MSQVTVAMLGARMHYAVPRLLHEAGLLERFYTDSYIGNKPWLEAGLRAIPSGLRPAAVARWLGRKEAVLPPSRVTSFEGLGIWYGRARSRARTPAEHSHIAREAAQRFNSGILQQGLGHAPVVWGFNGAALELFEAAKRQNKICVLEQTILPLALERRLLAEEQLRWPGWEKAPTNWAEPLALDGREEAEWTLADAIVTGSDFVRAGLIELGVSPGKIHVIPYGVDQKRFAAPADSQRSPRAAGAPLKALFAGEVGLRKGVPDLLEAVRDFRPGEIELRFAGGVSLRADKVAPYQSLATFLGHVSRAHMRELFQWADVFVISSIVEGSATVTYEAIMAGCPVIATPNTGSIIQNGIDGFIVPIHSPQQIAAALRRYCDEPALLPAQQHALADTRTLADLERYKKDLVQLIRKL